MSRRCKLVVYGIVGLIGFALLALLVKLLFFSGLFTPMVSLNGPAVMEMEVHTKFQDPGATARFRFSDYSDEITVTSNLNPQKLGTYTLHYTFDKYQKQVQRTVRVVDTTPPKIQLKEGNSIRVFENKTFQDPGYQAMDAYDGDVSDQVKVTGSVNTQKQGKYVLTYSVKDANGNEAHVQRHVQVCADPTMTKLYYDHDSYDNTMEEWWFRKSENHQRTTGAQEEALLAKYDSYYQGPKQKVLYLTFDEGGNDITYIKQIAEVLKKNNVTATYFLTRNYIKTEADFIRQLVKDGNVIGNHTWHHYDMTTLANAQSIDAFVAEITETEKTYLEVTGQPMKKIFRFPKGGSSERAMKLVQDLGYSNYFWSHAYYDYASDVSKREALKTLMDHYHEGAIYLLHPSNKGNYEAMDSFLKQMKDLGYTFKTVDTIREDTKK